MARHPIARLFTRLAADEAGATAIEYALIGTLVSIFIIGSLQAFQGSLTNLFTFIKDTVGQVIGG